MAISTISPKSKIQGLPGTTRLVFSKKAISTDFFATDASLYSNQTATYYLTPGTYGLIAASEKSTATIKVYQNKKDTFFFTTLPNNSLITKYITIPEDSTATESEYSAIDIYYPEEIFQEKATSTINHEISNNKDLFLGSFSNFIYRSTDAITWTTTVVGEGGASFKYYFVNNEFMAIYGFKRTLYVSTDSITWSTATISFSTETGPTAIAYGNSAYVISGSSSGIISFSTNKINWTTLVVGTEGFEDVIFVSSKFIATSRQRLYESTNGINWATSSNQELDKIYYLNNKIIGIRQPRIIQAGEHPRVYESTDGITWTTTAVLVFTTFTTIVDFEYFAKTGKYYLTTNRPLSLGGHPRESTDLITWTTIESNATVFTTAASTFSNINYLDNKLFIVSSSTGIYLDAETKPISVQLFKAVD